MTQILVVIQAAHFISRNILWDAPSTSRIIPADHCWWTINLQFLRNFVQSWYWTQLIIFSCCLHLTEQSNRNLEIKWSIVIFIWIQYEQLVPSDWFHKWSYKMKQTVLEMNSARWQHPRLKQFNVPILVPWDFPLKKDSGEYVSNNVHDPRHWTLGSSYNQIMFEDLE